MSPSSPPVLPAVATAAELDLAWASLAWLRALTRPVFVGEEHLPSQRPLLFVGNHTLGGIVDVPQLFFRLQRHHGILVRSLGEKAHWRLPGWRRMLERFGAVDGNRDNAAALFQAGECVLVFPGGAREAFKRADQRYQLLWGERLGFARLALRHGVTVVPFAAVGADDVFDVVADQDRLMQGIVGEWVQEVGIRPEVVPPLLKGQGPLGMPGIRRQYFAFLPPVSTAEWGGRDDDEAAWAVRRQVEAAVQQGIDQLLAMRAADPDADWKRVLGRKAVKGLGRLLAEATRPPGEEG